MDGLTQKGIDQSGFAVVNVGNDSDISHFFDFSLFFFTGSYAVSVKRVFNETAGRAP